MQENSKQQTKALVDRQIADGLQVDLPRLIKCRAAVLEASNGLAGLHAA